MDYTLIIPDETLCYIFALVQVNEPGAHRPFIIMLSEGDRARTSGEEVLGWIKITFVNRRWRQVAIDDAMLWTRLNGELGWDWVNEFVNRSKSAPLSLDARFFPPPSDENELPVEGLVAAHHARLAKLRLHAWSPGSLAILDGLLTKMFGNLEDVRLSAHYDINGSEPLTSFLEHTPRLRRLTLRLPFVSYAALDWQATCLVTLTHVDLALSSEASSAITPAFLNALRRMTALTHLAIHESSPSIQISCDHHCSGTPGDLIHLRNMSSVVITSSLETHTHLLRHIRFPSHTRLNFGANGLIPNPPEASRTYKALGHELGSFIRAYAEPPAYSSACLFFETIDDDVPDGPGNTALSLGLGRAVQARRAEVVSSHEVQVEDPHGVYGINDFSVQVHDAKASDILKCLPLGDVRFLTLTDTHVFSPHGLQYLEDPTLFPNLRIVDMPSDYLDFYTVISQFAEGAAGTVTTYPLLERILRARREMGSPLQGIYLHIAETIAGIEATGNSVMRGMIESLKAIEGVEIVSSVFDAFAV